MGTVESWLPVIWNSGLETDKGQPHAPAMYSQVHNLRNRPNWRMCRPKRQSGYFLRQMPIASDRHLNKIYITWCLNTVQVYKTHQQNISRILRAHNTVTYVMPTLCFLCFCFISWRGFLGGRRLGSAEMSGSGVCSVSSGDCNWSAKSK